jgi:HK97 family phage prohead protease
MGMKFIGFKWNSLQGLQLKNENKWKKEGVYYKLLNPDPEKDRQILHVNFKKMGSLDPSLPLGISGVANANIVDRMQERLDPRGLITEDYMKNPQLLAHHSYYHPIGQVDVIDVQDDGVHFSAWIGNPAKGPLTEMQKEIRSLVAQGILKTVSVGFIPHKIKEPVWNEAGDMTEGPVIEQWELLELSIVSVPANQDSIFEIRDCAGIIESAKVDENAQESPISLNDNQESGMKKKTSFEQFLDAIAEQSMIVQSLIFSKEVFKTADSAKKWATDHGFNADKVDDTEDSFRLRQREPSEFDESTFRTIDITEGVKAVAGKIKTEQNAQDKPKPEDEEKPKPACAKVEDIAPMLEKIVGMLETMQACLDRIEGTEEPAEEPQEAPAEEPAKSEGEKASLAKIEKLEAALEKMALTLEALVKSVKE